MNPSFNSLIRRAALTMLLVLTAHCPALALDPPSKDESPAWMEAEAKKRLDATNKAKAESDRADRAERDRKIAEKDAQAKQKLIDDLQKKIAELNKPPLQKAPPPPAMQGIQRFQECADCPVMVIIPQGSFTIGSSAQEQKLANDAGASKDTTDIEKNGFLMNIASFALAQTEVTKAQFAAFVKQTNYRTTAETQGSCYVWAGQWVDKKDANWQSPGFAQTDQEPAVCISWNDAQVYIQWLNTKLGVQAYRLPSEAQWEYAARARSTTAFHTGERINPSQAHYGSSVSYNGSDTRAWLEKTMPVGQFAANAFGLNDMHGNALEWTQDCFNPSHEGARSNGAPRETGDCSRRVLRGGSWNSNPAILRSATRVRGTAGNRYIDIGFRPARTLP